MSKSFDLTDTYASRRTLDIGKRKKRLIHRNEEDSSSLRPVAEPRVCGMSPTVTTFAAKVDLKGCEANVKQNL